MTRSIIVNAASLFVVLLLAMLIAREGAKHRYTGEVPEFAQNVNLAAIESLAVHTDGRLNSFASHARSMMQYVSGAHAIKGQSASFSYLDMMFRSELYNDEPIIYIKNKVVGGQVADAIDASGVLANDPKRTETLERIIDKGLVAPSLLSIPPVQALIEQLNTDLIRTAPEVQRLRSAMGASNPQTLVETLAIIPPQGDDPKQPWFSLGDLINTQAGGMIPGLAPDAQVKLLDQVNALAQAWHEENVAGVESSAAALAATLRSINPTLYPSADRLSWERFYFASKNLTWVWMVYLLAVAFLLMSVVYRWRGASIAGWAIFLLAFALHTGAILLRWYVSGRWPNANMFEAVTTSVWFGGCAAIILEILVRRTAMRNIFMLGSAVASMVALMCANFMPISLNAGISNKMPVLHDVWLYIHTNVIIFSYCLIAMAAVSAMLYLRYRLVGGAAEFARVGGAGSLVMHAPGIGGTGVSPVAKTAVGNTTGSSSAPSQSYGAGTVFDGATMVLMELSFILLWAGLVMGAIWADHSWGRPWGWDPKEVFALNTFIVFLLLVHVRLKVKDKGLWTAILAIVGAGVMLFNWIIINFQIVGLHSYA